MRKLLFCVLLAGLLPGCKTAKVAPPRDRVLILAPTELNAVSIQESLTRYDELMMAWSVSVLNSKNQLVSTAHAAWGVQKTRKGDRFTDFQPVKVVVPPESKIVATAVLMEIEDYSKAQRLVGQIRKYTGMAGSAAALLEATEVTNPLGYLVMSLQAAGIALDHSDKLDPDDVLGTWNLDRRDSELVRGTVNIPVRFQKSARFNRYRYDVKFRISVE